MRPAFVRLLLASSLLLASCGESGGPSPIALRDPLGLADVTEDLRLTVFPSTERSCDSTGDLIPALPEDPTAELLDATVDRRFAVDELEQEVVVEEGSYVVAVQGWGTDPVTMRMGVLVTRGCTTGTIEAGQERPLTIMLQDIEGMGECADGLLSPDEQCEDATGPYPCDAATCRTTEAVANTTTDGVQDAPSVAWSAGGRMVFGYQNGATDLRWNFLDERAETITSPSALALDATIDTIGGVQTSPDVATSPARYVAGLQDLSTGSTEGGDIYVRFFTPDRAPESGMVQVVPSPGAQTRPRLALASGGEAMVVFTDSNAASGATGAFFAAGSDSPTAFPIGSSGASNPSVASNGSGFIVVWVEGGAVQAQRYGGDGSATDPAPIAVSESPTPAVPDVAYMADGRAYVVWGSGSGVRGRALDAAGTPGMATDLAGSGARPRVAEGAGRFLAVWEDGGTISARYLDGNGALADNHEQPRTNAAFPVGSGGAPDVAGGAVAGQGAAVVSWAGAGGDILLRTVPLP
jgi:hypothetical protein